jgi:hypothetical protein
MTAALFTLAGTLVGVLSTLAVELVRSRHENRKALRDDLRSVCAELASEVSRLRDLSHELYRSPDDDYLQRAAKETHSRARALWERLRLTSSSVTTQEAARWLIHCAYHQWRCTQGDPGDFWESRRGLDSWLTKFYAASREELGLRGQDVYDDPPSGLPIPGEPSAPQP